MTRQRWVGLFFFVGLAFLAGLSVFVDDESHLFKRYGLRYRTIMPEIGSVGEGSIVRMAGSGIRIGRVDKVGLKEVGGEYRFEIFFSIKEEAEGLEVALKEDSTARLAMTTLLQGMHLEVTPGSPGAPTAEEGALIASEESADLMSTFSKLGDVMDGLGDGGLGKMLLGNEGLEKVGKVLDRVAQDGGLGKWVLGEKAHENLEPTLAELRKAVENVRKGTDLESGGTVARLLHDEEMGSKFDGIVTDLREGVKGVRKFSEDISEGKGTLARLASDEELGEKVDGIVTDFRAVAADLRGGKSLLARLISDEEMGEDLKTTIANISRFAEGLGSGEGTISRLVNDPELYVEAKRLVTQAREAVEDAREAAPISAFTSILFGALQ
jgi:phospholipid/cholesterol/gamma-HCH transport system substrate-binding protein